MRIGRYELLERLGAGAMGEVFRARDHDLGRDVAIKFLAERFASDSDRLARFTQEARAASSLNHPNIVTVHEIGQASGLPYIVMELVDGRTLRHFLRDRPLPTRETLDVAVQLADGLAKAHAAGIVHRDLKPENVMVTKDGFVKILDFGLAKLLPDDVLNPSGSDDLATQTTPGTAAGAILGTAGYMSPEQARGEPAGHRSDQFALGALLYELVTHRVAFREKSFVQTLNAVIERDPMPIAALNPELPAPVRWVIERCLEKDPERRYASTVDLARELRSVREHLSEVGSGISGPASRPASRWAGRGVRTAIALAVVLAVILLAPRLREAVNQWGHRPVLPAEMRLAVLPVSVAGIGNEDTRCCAGLLDYVAVRLTDLARLQGNVSVVPASELLAAGVNSPSAARRALGATVAVSVTVHGSGDSLLVTVSLADTEQVRQLTGVTKTFKRAGFSPEDVVGLLVPLLDVQLLAGQKSAWAGGASNVGDAALLYAQGLAQTPYQAAQGQLERYDQVRSLQQAIKLFNDAINLDPRYAAAHAALGEARVRLYRLTREPSDLALAEQSARQALGLDSTRPGAWVTLGMVLTQRGDTGGAEKAFGEAVARNPNGADTYREAGLAYQRARLWDKAEASYLKAIELEPKSWANYNYYGAFLLNARQRYPEAEAAFRRALEIAPENGRLWANLGGVYLWQERWDEAESALTKAARVYHSSIALSNLGWLQFVHRRDYAGAARTFEQAVQASPRDSRMWRNLAEARYWAPELRSQARAAYAQAAQLLEEELSVDPTNSAALASLADCRAMLGDRQGARSLAARALKAGVAADDWVIIVGTYEEIGDRQEALRQLRSAFAAGVAPSEFERAPVFAELRKDSRYAALVQAQAKKIGDPK